MDEKNVAINESVDAEEKVNEQQVEGAPEQEQENQPTVEELVAELAKEKAANAKLKSSLDQASSDAAKYKKALRQKQTAEEIMTEEKAKADEEYKQYVAELETYKKTAEAKARYALQGMSEELATKAAEAEIKGDMDELASIQKKHTDNLLKQREKEWLKSRPEVNVGNEEKDEKAALEKQIEEIMLRNQ